MTWHPQYGQLPPQPGTLSPAVTSPGIEDAEAESCEVCGDPIEMMCFHKTGVCCEEHHKERARLDERHAGYFS